MNVLSRVLVVAVLLACTGVADAQIGRRFRERAIVFNGRCLIGAVAEFGQCRLLGGGVIGCGISAGLGYWECSGSTLSAHRQRVRLARSTRRRAVCGGF